MSYKRLGRHIFIFLLSLCIVMSSHLTLAYSQAEDLESQSYSYLKPHSSFHLNGIAISRLEVDSEGNVYTVSSDGHVYAIDKNGDRLWSYPIDVDQNMGEQMHKVHIALGRDHLYVATKDYIYSLSMNGTRNWIYKKNGTEIQKFVLTEQEQLYILSSTGNLVSLSSQGEKLFQTSDIKFISKIPDSNHILIVSESNHILEMNTIGNITWEYKGLNHTVELPPSVNKDHMIVVSGTQISSLSASSEGNKLTAVPLGASKSTWLSSIDSSIDRLDWGPKQDLYISTVDKRIVILDKDGQQSKSRSYQGTLFEQMWVTDWHVFISQEDKVVTLNSNLDQTETSFLRPTAIEALSNQHIYMATRSGDLYILHKETASNRDTMVGISVNKRELQLDSIRQAYLSVTAHYVDQTTKSVTPYCRYKSSKPSIAYADEWGQVFADRFSGEVMIHITCGDYTDLVHVTVGDPNTEINNQDAPLPVEKQWEYYFEKYEDGVIYSKVTKDINQNIYFGTTLGHIFSFSSTGDIRWKKKVEKGHIYSSAVVKGERLFVPVCLKDGLYDSECSENRLYVYDLDGSFLWSSDSFANVLFPKPVINENGQIWVSSSPEEMPNEDNLESVDNSQVIVLDQHGDQIWIQDLSGKILNQPILISDQTKAYIISGISQQETQKQKSTLHIHRATDGKKLFSKEFDTDYQKIAVSPSDNIYLGNTEGVILALNDEGNDKWKYKAPSSVLEIQMVGDQQVFVRTQSHIIMLNEKGQSLWKKNLTDILPAQALIYDVFVEGHQIMMHIIEEKFKDSYSDLTSSSYFLAIDMNGEKLWESKVIDQDIIYPVRLDEDEFVFTSDYSKNMRLLKVNIKHSIQQEEGSDTVAENQEVSFMDVKDHWAEESIKRLAKLNIVKGMNETTFYPEGTVTREQFIKMVVEAMNYPIEQVDEFTYHPYGHISQRWSFEYILTAYLNGILGPAFHGKYLHPEKPITREEMAQMVAKALKLEPNQEASKALSDLGEKSSFTKGSIGAILKTGIITGYPDSTFAPDQKASRAEAVVIIDRLLHYLETHQNQQKTINGS